MSSIHNEQDYDHAVEQMNELLDEVGTNEEHPLYELLDTLGTLMHAYEEAYHVLPDSPPVEVLRFLIDEHALTQSELPGIGWQGVVSEVLSGKRELNVRQIRALLTRFEVSPGVFI